MDVFNDIGQKMRGLANANQTPGYYTLHWDGTDDLGQPLSTGLYLVVYEANSTTQVKKVLVIKR